MTPRWKKTHYQGMTPEKAREIRDAFCYGQTTYREIAERFDSTYSQVWRIVNGESWSHA